MLLCLKNKDTLINFKTKEALPDFTISKISLAPNSSEKSFAILSFMNFVIPNCLTISSESLILDIFLFFLRKFQVLQV